MNEYALSLGSNMGDRLSYLQQAIDQLHDIGLVQSRSPIYETVAMYVEDQPKFLNMAVVLVSDLSPVALLKALKKIEDSVGREQTYRHGPRQVDLDIILCRDQIWQDDSLSIPHVSYKERAFVLLPLASIVADWQDPNTLETVGSLAKGCDSATVELFDGAD